MAGFDPRVESLDEFDEAEEMSATFCQKMTEQQFEEQTSEETEKALEELCNYLQANPEAYFQILRKRKQQEMENAGVFSFLKVKMMSLLHGEQYPACLVSPEDSARRLHQLKTDMHKAFAYSEESKGRRFSKRIAARSGTTDVTQQDGTPILPSQQPLRRTRLEPKPQDTADTPKKAATEKKSKVLRSASKNSKSPAALSKLGSPPVMAVLPSKTVLSENPVSVQPRPPPPPPPPPPMPAQFMSVGRELQNQSSQVRRRQSRLKDRESDGGRQDLARSPLSSVHGARGSENTPRPARSPRGRENAGPGGDKAATPSGSVPSSPDDEFVTPEAEIPVVKKHKRTLSTASTGSSSSHCSVTSLHSELMSSNPLSRLRATQVARSPGGTPLRMLNGPRMPSEPLHKALVTVLKEKFRNVRSPSPLAANSAGSLASPDPAYGRNGSFNATFSS